MLLFASSLKGQAKQGYIISTVEFAFLNTGDSLWTKFDNVSLMNGTKYDAQEIRKINKNELVIVIASTMVKGMINVDTKVLKNVWIEEEYLRGRVISIPVWYGESVDFYTKKLEDSPYNHHYIIYCLRGLAKTTAGDTSGAIDDYSFAMSYQPVDFAFGLKADLHRARGEYDKAISNYTVGMEFCSMPFKKIKVSLLDKDITGMLRDRGICYYEIGEHEKALIDFNESIEINPMDGKTYYYRGLHYITKGDKVKGCADLQKAVSLSWSIASDELKKYCNK